MKENIPDELKIYELSLIWKEAEYNFAFWEWLLSSLDWNNAYKTALSAVLKTADIHEYYLELMKFVALLCDEHTGVYFPECVEESPEYSSKLPILTRLVNGERVIANVKRAATDKVARWSIIKKIDGMDIGEYIKKIYIPIFGTKKKTARIQVLTVSYAAGRPAAKLNLNTTAKRTVLY